MVKTTKDCPGELAVAIEYLWPENEWSNAASIAWLESEFAPFAFNNTADSLHPCGTIIEIRDGVVITAERSVGYFQINTCNYPSLDWHFFYNAEFNAGKAYDLWKARGWYPWYFSAKVLGLI